MVGEHPSASYRARLRAYRYGTAAFRIDYAVAGPHPVAFAQVPDR
jgi:hypothetical protein